MGERMRLYLQLALLFAALFAFQGCAPRGETKTLNQVLAGAQQRYEAAPKSRLDADTSMKLNSLTRTMNELVAEERVVDVSDKLADVADLLNELSLRASYTSRPALAELGTQFRVMGTESGNPTLNKRKLIIARTFRLLASELETISFKL